MSTTNLQPVAQTRTATDRKHWIIEGNHLEFDLSDEAVEFLNRLLRDTGDSPEQLCRKALGLYRLAVNAQMEGKYVGTVIDPEVLDTEFINS